VSLDSTRIKEDRYHHRFRIYLRDPGILQSMSRRGQCWYNAPTESLFGTLKQETGLGKWYLENIREGEGAITDWIEN